MSSTSVPKAETREARSSRQEPPKRSPASKNRTPAASCAASCPRSSPRARPVANVGAGSRTARATSGVRHRRSGSPDRLRLLPVRPLDYLLQRGAGDDVLEAPDHDRSVFDVVEVVLVGARAAVEVYVAPFVEAP